MLITVLTQIGGFGIMGLATLLGLLVTERLGLRSRLMAQAETGALEHRGPRPAAGRGSRSTMLVCEAAIAAVLPLRLVGHYDYSLGRAVWDGVFHAVQAFNNGGFALLQRQPGRFRRRLVDLPAAVARACVAGSLGFPVLLRTRPRRPSPRLLVHPHPADRVGLADPARVGFLVILAFEWSNPRTFGPLNLPTKSLAAFTQGSMPRSGGFDSVDYAAMNTETLAVTIVLMFIGGGGARHRRRHQGHHVLPAGARHLGRGARRAGRGTSASGASANPTQRQAVTVALLGVALVAVGTVALIALTDNVPFEYALFEVTRAFGTVGLTDWASPPPCGPAAQLLLVALMFIGRVGTDRGRRSALALNTARHSSTGYPEGAADRWLRSAERTKVRADSVVVIGLGRFGSQVAESLVRLGHEVLAIDQDQKLVQTVGRTG